VYIICLDNERLIPSDVTSFMDVEKPMPLPAGDAAGGRGQSGGNDPVS